LIRTIHAIILYDFLRFHMKIQPLIPFLATSGIVSLSSLAIAQIVPPSTRIPVADNTLDTQVSSTNNDFTITGGLNKGQNLFHSFQDFSIPTGGAATFINPVENKAIITRVTGNFFSDIDGTINTQGANFFLINPNGILFGANTQLNVGQTFIGSTANGIDLLDAGGQVYRFGTNGNNDAPLLTINSNALLTPARLILNGNNGQINNVGTLETPNYNQYIGLFGGNVSMNGGWINAQGGRVEIGGLSAAGTVELGVEGNILHAQFPTNVNRSDVSFTNAARVNVAWDGGADIAISARNLELLSGSVLRGGIESGLGTSEAIAGDIKLNATENILIGGSGGIGNSVRVDSIGRGGNIDIQAGTFSLQDNASIQAATAGTGNAGNINIRVAGAADVSGSGTVIDSTVRVTANGNAGNIIIAADSFKLSNDALLLSTTSGKGNAGNMMVTAKNAVSLTGSNIFSTVNAGGVGKGGTIEINAASLSISNGNQLLTTTRSASATQPAGIGDAGNVNINVTGAVDIAGSQDSFLSKIGSSVETGAVGNGGNININAGSFSLRDGSSIESLTASKGNAGNVTLKVKNAVDLINTTIFSSVEAGGVGKGGTIEIDANSLSISNSTQLLTTTRSASATQPAGIGDAGNVNINVTGAVDIAGSQDGFFSKIGSSVATGAVGRGGNININAGSFSLRDGASIESATAGTGNAGNVTVRAKDAVSLINSSVFTTVEAGGIGKGGTIDIKAASLSLQDGAQLLTNTQFGGRGDAGTIRVNVANFITISGKNDNGFSGLLVTSRSNNGAAGDLTISAPKITLENGGILAAQSAYGTGGNINIANTNLLILRRGSRISATAGGTALQDSNGGSITINLPNGFIIAAPNENSDITANAFGGKGGKVSINTQQNFWIAPLSRTELEKLLGTTDPTQLDPVSLPTNNITAISQVNPNLSGQVNTTPPEIDITAGLTPLPNNVTDPADRINPNCSPKAIANNSFTTIGRGGIPASPKDPLNGEAITTNWVRLNPQAKTPSTPITPNLTTATQSIVEAQAWRLDRNGDILLVARSAPNRSFHQSQPGSGCIDRAASALPNR
jgi:filamentous hemagglutinin family protein